MNAAALLSRVLLGAILLLAGAVKALNPAEAALSVGGFHMTPSWLTQLIGVCLPGVELAVGAALWAGWQVRGAALVAASMSLMFMTAVGAAMVRQLDIACGCFGAIPVSPRADVTTMSIDIAMLMMSLILLRPPRAS